MRYFTPELYRKMQHSHDTPDFMRRWDEACRRAEQERETARPFLSEDMAYYVDLGWHDARIDGIRADGDTVRFRFDGEAADVELVNTYDRTDILKGRIARAIFHVAVYDRGKSLTETEKDIVALDEAVILLSQEADRDNGLWPHGSRTTLCPLTDGTLRRLAAIAGKSRLPRLGELVRHLQVHEVGETDAAAGVGRFLRSCGITAMEAYREAEAWLTGYVMAHLGELKREDDARQDCCRGATQQSRRL